MVSRRLEVRRHSLAFANTKLCFPIFVEEKGRKQTASAMTTGYTLQKFFVGVVLLGTDALLAVWTVLLNDVDKLAAATPPSGAYRSTRNYVLVATVLLANIGFLLFLKMVTHSQATCGPFYAGLLASQALLSAAFVHVAFLDAWIGDATYAPYYSNLGMDLLSGMRLQLACMVMSWTIAGFVCAVCFDRQIPIDTNTHDTSARHALRGRGAAGDFFTEEDGFGGQAGVPGGALRRRCRSPGASMHHVSAHSYGPVLNAELPTAKEMGVDWDLYKGETARDAPQFYVPAGPVFAPARRA